jgi:hypothetical protein
MVISGEAAGRRCQNALTAMDDGQRGQGGVLEHGTYEEDDRVTWEAVTTRWVDPARP